MKVNRNVLKHLGIAKQIVQGKIESWVGREPFPGDPLKTWKAMLGDLNYELHDVEETDAKEPLTPRMRGVLLQYRTLLEEQDAFWAEHTTEPMPKWKAALKSLDSILDNYETTKDEIVVPVTVRPDSKCIEFGRCQIKVKNDDMQSQTPIMINGQWDFGSEGTYSQERECKTCGKVWNTTNREGKVNTMIVKKPTRIML